MNSVAVASLLDVLIVDDHKIFLDGLRMTLRTIESVKKIYQAENGNEALSTLCDNSCNVVLMDYNLPVMNGAICTREIKRNYPDMKVIAISVFDDPEHVNNMFESGVDGYLLKNTSKTEIELALSNVMHNRYYFSKDLATNFIDKTLIKIGCNKTDKFKLLSEREKEILKLLYKEYSSKQIADTLCISERTVEFYRQSMIKKTDSKNIVGLIKYALISKLVDGF